MNKADLSYPAAWVHGAIHLLASWLFVPFPFAAVIAVTHVLIDTRRPMQWWRNFCGQTAEGEAAIHVAFWSDQVADILILSIVALAAARIG